MRFDIGHRPSDIYRDVDPDAVLALLMHKAMKAARRGYTVVVSVHNYGIYNYICCLCLCVFLVATCLALLMHSFPRRRTLTPTLTHPHPPPLTHTHTPKQSQCGGHPQRPRPGRRLARQLCFSIYCQYVRATGGDYPGRLCHGRRAGGSGRVPAG